MHKKPSLKKLHIEYVIISNIGWTMVFKTIAGETGKISDIWTNTLSYDENSLEALNTDNSFKHHYKNRIVLNNNWKTFDDEVCFSDICFLILFRSSKNILNAWFEN